MSRDHKSRIEKLESVQPKPDAIAWVELTTGSDRAFIRYQDGRREEVSKANAPGVKGYVDYSPDDWSL